MQTNDVKFDAEKMRKYLEQDALLRFAVKDLQKRGHDEVSALEITFNSYVLDDFTMTKIYQTL